MSSWVTLALRCRDRSLWTSSERAIPTITAMVRSTTTVMIIVVNMTMTSPLGDTCALRMACQSNMPTATNISIPDSTASGMYCTTAPSPATKTNKTTL
ncbi:Uncharacterised protein [Mycobacterium tuberculosis]|uniref:Uncharacterized protein n=1 Tax=Mycobacterium tuberculosis TaxID=1773 RepID=A0A655JKS6_MYCTX|nr:Uncharacterised protein [Mycobacterium tuberculosis]